MIFSKLKNCAPPFKNPGYAPNSFKKDTGLWFKLFEYPFEKVYYCF